MRKKLIPALAALALLALAAFLMSPEQITGPRFEDRFDQMRYDRALDADIESGAPFLRDRAVGLAHLQKAFAVEDGALPALVRPQAAAWRAHIDTYKSQVDAILAKHDAGDDASTAYRELEIESALQDIAAKAARRDIDLAFSAALRPFYDNGIPYSEEEWEAVRRGVGERLATRDVSAQIRAYLTQPADNVSAGRLIKSLRALREVEAALFFARLDYEIYYQQIRGYGALDSGLVYGRALYEAGAPFSEIRAIYEEPVDILLASPDTDLMRYVHHFRVYLEALEEDAPEARSALADRFVAATRTRISTNESAINDVGEMAQYAPMVRATIRMEGARNLQTLGFAREAIPIAQSALDVLEGARGAEQNRLDARALLQELDASR